MGVGKHSIYLLHILVQKSVMWFLKYYISPFMVALVKNSSKKVSMRPVIIESEKSSET